MGDSNRVAIMTSAPTGGTSNITHLVTAPVAVATIGSSEAISATIIAINAGRVKILDRLRKYRIVKETSEGIVICR